MLHPWVNEDEPLLIIDASLGIGIFSFSSSDILNMLQFLYRF